MKRSGVHSRPAWVTVTASDGVGCRSSVEGPDKSQPAFFKLARERATVPVSHCLFVGERTVATSAGFRVSPHSLHALHLIESEFFAKPRTLLGKE